MNFIRNFLKNSAIKTYRKEMEQFVSNLQAMDSDEIAFLMQHVLNVRYDLYLSEGINLMQPHVLEAKQPACCTEFSALVRKLQSKGQYDVAAAFMPWVHTLRATLYIELRGLCRSMWAELARGMDDPTDADFPEGFTPKPL